jgi:hypothetical protein
MQSNHIGASKHLEILYTQDDINLGMKSSSEKQSS